MNEKLILTDDSGNTLNFSLTCPLYSIIDNYRKQKIDVLHFKLYDVPVTYLNELYFGELPSEYKYIALNIDPKAKIWSIYPNRVKSFSTYQVIHRNVLYDIKSTSEDSSYTNIIVSSLLPYSDTAQFSFYDSINISKLSNNCYASIRINGLQLNEGTYKHIGTITILPDIDLDLINEESIYTLFRNIRTYLPQLVKINEECNIVPTGLDTFQQESSLLASKYLFSHYNIPPNYIYFRYSLFPVLSIYSNILIYEINKISKSQLPFSSMCPVPDDKFIEEYEAQKQILQIL